MKVVSHKKAKKEPDADNLWPGGTHGDNEPYKKRGVRESNHVPPTSVYANTPYAAAFPTTDSRPAHIMPREEHRARAGSFGIGGAPSSGSSETAQKHRSELVELMKEGKFDEAFILDMRFTRGAAIQNGHEWTIWNRGFLQAARVAYDARMPNGDRVLNEEQYRGVITAILNGPDGKFDSESVEWAENNGIYPSETGSSSDPVSTTKKRDRDPDSEDGAAPAKRRNGSGGSDAGSGSKKTGESSASTDTGSTKTSNGANDSSEMTSEANEINEHLATLNKHWDDLNGRDKVVSVEDLHKELQRKNPKEVKAAIQFLIDNPDILSKLDTAAGGGDVDGKISNADLEAFRKLDPMAIARENESRNLSKDDTDALKTVNNNWDKFLEGIFSSYVRKEDFERVAEKSDDKALRDAASHIIKNPALFDMMDTMGKGGKKDGDISIRDKHGLDDLSAINGGKHTSPSPADVELDPEVEPVFEFPDRKLPGRGTGSGVL